MPVSSKTIALLVALGATGPALLEIIQAIEEDNEDADALAEFRAKNAARQARWRQRQRDSNVTRNVTSNVTITSTKSNEINGVARVEDNNNLPLPPTISKSSDELFSIVPPPKPKPKRLPRQLPDDWVPDDKTYGWAYELLGSDRYLETIDTFRDYWRGTGKPMVDWNATFRNWVRRDLERQSTGRTFNGHQSITGHNQRVLQETFRRMDEAERRRSEKGDGPDLFLVQGRPSSQS